MVKTDTQSSVVGSSQNATDLTKGSSSVRARDALVEGSTQSNSDDSAPIRGEETVDVARARDVYMRTGGATSPGPGGRLATSEEAAKLVETLREELRLEPKRAMEAQLKGISPNLAELLRS